MEYIQADIWVRFQRMQGHTRCTSSAPTTRTARRSCSPPRRPGSRRRNSSPRSQRGRKQYLDGFHIGFDNWHSTDSPENTELSQDIYRKLKAAGLDLHQGRSSSSSTRSRACSCRPLHQGRVPELRRQGPVRRRLRELQHASTRRPTLMNPYSTLSGATPVLKTVRALFLQALRPAVHRFPEAVARYAGPPAARSGQQGQGMARRRRATRRSPTGTSRAIAPYFGIRDPGCAGRSTSMCGWTRRSATSLRLKNYFDTGRARADGEAARSTSSCRIRDRADPLHRQGHHLLPHRCSGRRCSSSPASRTRCPTTSTCTASSPCRAKRCPSRAAPASSPLRYLELGMNPEWLRYYIAAKLNANVEDIDFNPRRFRRAREQRPGRQVRQHRQPLRGFINASSAASSRASGGTRSAARIRRPRRTQLAALYEEREFGKALREVMELADLANQYVDEKQALGARQADRPETRAAGGCSRAHRPVPLLTIYLKPVLPKLAADAERFLNVPPLRWGDVARPSPRDTASTSTSTCSAASRKSSSTPLFEPIARSPRRRSATPRSSSTKPRSSRERHHQIDDFSKLDLRVAKITRAEQVEGADKLLKLDARRRRRHAHRVRRHQVRVRAATRSKAGSRSWWRISRRAR